MSRFPPVHSLVNPHATTCFRRTELYNDGWRPFVPPPRRIDPYNHPPQRLPLECTTKWWHHYLSFRGDRIQWHFVEYLAASWCKGFPAIWELMMTIWGRHDESWFPNPVLLDDANAHVGIFFYVHTMHVPQQNHVPWGRLSLWKWVPGVSPGIKASGAFGWRPTTLVVPKRQKNLGS